MILFDVILYEEFIVFLQCISIYVLKLDACRLKIIEHLFPRKAIPLIQACFESKLDELKNLVVVVSLQFFSESIRTEHMTEARF